MPPPLNICIMLHHYKYEGENLLLQIFYRKIIQSDNFIAPIKLPCAHAYTTQRNRAQRLILRD